MDVKIVEKKAYLASQSFGLSLVDMTSGEVTSSAFPPFTGQNIALAGSTAVVTEYTPEGLGRLSKINMGTLNVEKKIDLGIPGSSLRDVAVDSAASMAVVASTYGIKVVDLISTKTPVTYPTTAYGVAVANGYAYVAALSEGLQILQLNGTSQAPTLKGSLTFSTRPYRDVAVQGGLAYLANQNGTLDIVDVSVLTAPRLIGTIGLGGFGYYVAVSGSYAAVISQNTVDYLEIIDISTPTQPILKSRTVVLSNPGAIYTRGVALNSTGTTAAVAVETEGLKLYDLTNPASPLLLDIEPASGTVGSALGVTVAGDYICVADSPAIISNVAY